MQKLIKFTAAIAALCTSEAHAEMGCGAQGATKRKFSASDPCVRPHINGNNGEWTNGDDMPPKGTKKKTKEEKKIVKAVRNVQLTKQKALLVKAMKEKPGPMRETLGSSRIIKGRGDYSGEAIGRNLGSKLGGWVGGKLHSLFSTIFGSGDYQVSDGGVSKGIGQNSFVSGASIPTMHTNNVGGSSAFQFHEYVGTFGMTTAFTVNTFPIDITSGKTFPWLSRIATNFGQYRVKGLVFLIKSLSSDYAGAASGLGSIEASVRYDVESRPPSSKSEILNSMFSTSGKPSVNQAIPVECAPQSTFLSLLKIKKSGQVPLDPQMYAMGFLDIATSDGSSNYPGAFELYAVYDIEVYKPQTDVPAGGPIFMMDLLGTTTNSLAPVPDSVNVKQPRVNTLGLTLDPGLKILYFPLTTTPGSVFLISWSYGNLTSAAVANTGWLSTTFAGGMGVAALFNDQTFSAVQAPQNATNTGVNSQILIVGAKYDGTGTAANPPRITFGLGAGTYIGYTGLLIISLIDRSVASGLTSRPQEVYSREEFFRYLCDCVAGRGTTSAPPGRERLVDWCRQFSQTLDWVISNPLPRSLAPFDYSIVEALSEMSKYCGYAPDRAISIEQALERKESTYSQSRKLDYAYPPSRPPSLDKFDETDRRMRADLSVVIDDRRNDKLHVLQSDELEYEDVEAPVATVLHPRGKPVIRSQLNGNNGSRTNTDDTIDIDGEKPTVNYPGLAVNGSSLRPYYQARIDAGWKIPELAPVPTSSKIGTQTIWFWTNGDGPLSKQLRKELRKKDGWTWDLMHRTACSAKNGVWCADRSTCPHCTTLSGNHGSATNTDDVKSDAQGVSEADSKVVVNPPGMSGDLAPVYAIISARSKKGWKLPEYAMMKTSVPNTWFWLAPPRIMQRKLNRCEPVGCWTIDKVRKVQCYAMRGLECTHSYSECPARVEVLNSDSMCKVDGKLRVGECGAAAHKGDGPEPCEVSDCSAPTHAHSKRGKKKDGQESKEKPAAPGAAQRIAKKKAKQLEACVNEDGSFCRLIDGDCELGRGRHYHLDFRAEALPPSGENPPSEREVHFPDEPFASVNDYMDDNKNSANAALLQVRIQQCMPAAKKCSDWADESLDEEWEREELRKFNEKKHAFGSSTEVKGDADRENKDVGAERGKFHIPEQKLPFRVEAPVFRPRPIAVVIDDPHVPANQRILQPDFPPDDLQPLYLQPEDPQPLPPLPIRPVLAAQQPRNPQPRRGLLPPPGAPQQPAPPPPPPPPPIPPPAPVGPPAPPAVAALPAPPNPAVLAADHEANLYNKAGMLFLHKDQKSIIDRQIVIRSLTAIARKDEVFKVIPNVVDRIVEITDDAGVAAARARIRGAERRSEVQRRRTFPVRVFMWMRQKPVPLLYHSDCNELDEKEAIEPYSLVTLTRWEKFVVAAGGMVVLFITLWGLKKLARTQLICDMKRINTFIVRCLGGTVKCCFVAVKGLTRAVAKITPPPPLASEGFNNVQPYASADTPLEKWCVMQNLYRMWIVGSLVAPINEEIAKRIGPYMLKTLHPSFEGGNLHTAMRIYSGAAFGFMEWYTNAFPEGPGGSLVMLAYRVLSHTFLAYCLPIKKAVLLHSCFNATVIGLGVLATHQRLYGSSFSFSSPSLLPECSVLAAQQLAVAVAVTIAPSVIASIVNLIKLHLPFRSYEFGQKIIEDICLDEYKMMPAPCQPAFRVKYGDPHCVPGHGATGSWGIDGFVGTTFRTCTHNEVISLCGRVGKFLPAHIDAARTAQIHRNWVRVTRTILDHLAYLHVKKIYQPIPYEEWCASFPPMRRDMLLDIAKNVHDMPALIAKSFIKKEIAVKDEANPIFKDPRWIQGCPPELSARVGPYLRKWAKAFRDSVAPDWTAAGIVRGSQIVYTCGMNAQEIGKAFARSIELITSTLMLGEKVIFLEDDQSRFDLHLLSGPFYALQRVYRRYLPRRVAALLARHTSKGVSSLGTKYSIPFTMQSGWPDTSIGDTLINATMKYDIHGFGRRWVSIICGDDSVTITTDREIARVGGVAGIVASYADFGMEVEALIRDDALSVEFCSGRFFPTGETFVLMPRTGRILSKIGWDMLHRSRKNRIAWIRSIGTTMREYGQIDPLMNALGLMIHDRVGLGNELPTKDSYKYYVCGKPYVLPSEFDVATYYDHHYQLNSADIAQLVSIIRSSTIGSFLTDSRLAFMASHDL